MWRRRAARPIPVSGMGVGGPTQIFNGPCSVVGFSLINLAVAAAGSINDGALGLVFFTMGASSHDTQWMGDRGIECQGSLTVTVTAGTVTGVVWVTDIPEVEYGEDESWLRNLMTSLSQFPPELQSPTP